MVEIKHNFFRRYKLPLLAIFFFLMGCMVAINLAPIEKTCRIEDSDKAYNIMRNAKFKNPELIVLILSAPRNLHKRNTIRQTWLKLQPHSHDIGDDDVKPKMKHYFAVGSLGLNTDEILHLSSEQSQFEDILILPILDSYNNLTLKVVKSYEWLTEQYDFGLGFKYVLKCDDDSFVRLDNLIHELMQIELMYLKADLQHVLSSVSDPSPYLRLNVQLSNKKSQHNNLQLYWGYFNGAARVKKVGKWKEDDWIACDYYTPYALGGGYLLSRKLVSFLGRNSDDLRYFNSEDVSVGLWLQSVDNVLRIHDTRFDTEWISRGCQNPFLVRHNISMAEMHVLYENIQKTSKMCSDEVLSRTYYHYNWSASPSHCCSTRESIFN